MALPTDPTFRPSFPEDQPISTNVKKAAPSATAEHLDKMHAQISGKIAALGKMALSDTQLSEYNAINQKLFNISLERDVIPIQISDLETIDKETNALVDKVFRGKTEGETKIGDAKVSGETKIGDEKEKLLKEQEEGLTQFIYHLTGQTNAGVTEELKKAGLKTPEEKVTYLVKKINTDPTCQAVKSIEVAQINYKTLRALNNLDLKLPNLSRILVASASAHGLSMGDYESSEDRVGLPDWFRKLMPRPAYQKRRPGRPPSAKT